MDVREDERCGRLAGALPERGAIDAETLTRPPLRVFDFAVDLECGEVRKPRRQVGEQRFETAGGFVGWLVQQVLVRTAVGEGSRGPAILPSRRRQTAGPSGDSTVSAGGRRISCRRLICPA
jgi:hypothetical protein